MDIVHLCYVLRIAGYVYPQSVNGEYIPIVASFGMELLLICSRVVGRHRFYHPGPDGGRLTVLQHVALSTEQFAASWVGHQLGTRLRELVYSFGIEMVGVLVGEQDQSGFGPGGIISRGWNLVGHRINVYPLVANTDRQGAMFDAIQPNEGSHWGDKKVGDLLGYFVPGRSPSHIALVELCDAIALVCQQVGSFLTAPATAAIHSNRLVFGQDGHSPLQEIVALYVYIDGLAKMALCIFTGCPHIQQNGIGVIDSFLESINVKTLVLRGLCRAGGESAEQGEKGEKDVVHKHRYFLQR